jgi:hypothetical protein
MAEPEVTIDEEMGEEPEVEVEVEVEVDTGLENIEPTFTERTTFKEFVNDRRHSSAIY